MLTKPYLKALGGLMLASLISSCASLNGDFDCPLKEGVHCQTLDQVNRAVDEGRLGGPTPDKGVTQAKEAGEAKRVWLAPFTDKQGNQYAGTMVKVAKA